MAADAKSILEVRAKFNPDSLLIELGMQISDRKWLFPYPKLEVRLYADPFPDFGRPELMNSPLPDRSTTIGKSFGIPGTPFTISREATGPAFLSGTVFADADGKCYPVTLDLSQMDLAAGGAISYPVVRWPVNSEWLDTPCTIMVRLGMTVKHKFEMVAQFPFTSRDTAAISGDPVRPDATFALPDIDPLEVPPSGVKPRLFISYSRAYLSQIRDVVASLESVYYDVWFDERDIGAGEKWRRQIAKAIQSAARVLFFVSPESCESEYCAGEIAHAKKYGIHIIPIRFNLKTPLAALEKIGLSADDQIIEWNEKSLDANIKRLLANPAMVKPPLMRDIRRLDREYERLHRRYLNTFFRPEFNRIPLADITDEDIGVDVPLTSVYIPLPVDMSFTIRVDEDDKSTITDWWVTVEKSETRADETVPEELRERKLREWPNLKVGEDSLRLIIDDAERQLIAQEKEEDANFYPEQHWFMEAHDAANVQSRMVLTGNPGSGKSTFIKHLALCLAGDVLKDKPGANVSVLGLWVHPAYTPIFIRLADIVAQEFPKPDDRADTEDFDAFLKKQLENWDIAAYWRDLQDQLYDGSAIILLDGLDEVPNAVETWRRNQIKDFVASIVNEYGKCRVIVTSRPFAYDGTWKLDGFGQTTLKPIDWDGLTQLACALFAQLPEIREPEAEASAFIEALRRNTRQDFWTNPLQFTMGATLWMRNRDKPVDQRIPPSESELYDKSVNLMLEKWVRRDPTAAASVAELLKVTPEQLRTGLERLALWMQEHFGSDEKATFDWTQLIKPIDECRYEALPEGSRERFPAIDYNVALDSLEQRAGLLTAEKGRIYRFQHLSYQEYLAACELGKPARFPHAVTNKVIAQPGRWRNVVPLLWDIVAQRGLGDLQSLAKSLLPEVDSSQLERESPLWELIAQLSRLQAGHETLLHSHQKSCLAEHLVNLIERAAPAPVERAEMGRLLGELGDPRPGVGTMALQIDGKTVELPDIAPSSPHAWCDVRAPDSGKFVMGADIRSLKRRREVELRYGFKMGKYLVTNRQFQTFIDSGEYDDPKWWDGFPSKYQPQDMAEQSNQIANHPRGNVSWYQAVAFCRWITVKCRATGLIEEKVEIRLPTEEEWEYAARGTDERTYSYEGEFDAAKGNISETGIGKTCAVGLFPDGASPFGILDMSGNVWEWCLNKDERSADRGIDASEDRRVLRGGSFNYDQYLTTAWIRSRLVPGSTFDSHGFRLVCGPPIASLISEF